MFKLASLEATSDLTRLLPLSVPPGRAGTLAHSPTRFFSSLFFPSGRKHYLISFPCCSILEQGDNGGGGGVEIHVSDSHTRPLLLSPPRPPSSVRPPPSLSPRKISIAHPPPTPSALPESGGLLSHGARGRGGGGGNFSRPEPNNLISPAPTRTRLPPPPYRLRAATVSVVYFI